MNAGPHRRSESGFTLIEILVVIAVMVPLVLGATAGLFTAIKLSDSSASAEVLGAALQNSTELLGSGADYIDCAGVDDYETMPVTDGVTTSVSSIAYWDQPTATYISSCGTDQGAQQITVEARFGGATSTATFVKRDRSQPVSNCAWTMLADGASRLFPLDEPKSDDTAIDLAAGENGTYEKGHNTGNADGVCASDSDTSARLNGKRFVSTAGTVQTGRDVDRSQEIWFRTKKSKGVLMAVGDTASDASDDVALLLSINTDGNLVYSTSRSSKPIVSPAEYDDNAWHHVVAVHHGGGGAELYVDGRPVGSDPDAVSADIDKGHLRIGYENTDGFSEGFGSKQNNANFDGWVRFAGWYERALTETQVSSHYALGTGG